MLARILAAADPVVTTEASGSGADLKRAERYDGIKRGLP
jgi:hypothetical protein